MEIKLRPSVYCAAHRAEMAAARAAERKAIRRRNEEHIAAAKAAARQRRQEEERRGSEEFERGCQGAEIFAYGFAMSREEYDNLLLVRREETPGGRRRTALARATPKWADKDEIQRIYAIRDLFNRKYPRFAPFHVDHIIPIQGRMVCGLHVAANLTIIPATENIKKGNRFSDDA